MCFKKGNSKEKALNELFEKYEEEIYSSSETKESKKMITEILKLQDSFYKGLNEEQKKKFDKIDKLQLDYDGETKKNIFIYGFKLAIKLMLESAIN